MGAWLKTAGAAIAGSFWFLPSLVAIAAVILARAAVAVDTSNLLIGWEGSWLYPRFGPEGARAILSAIAGGMMTMASLVFSLTFVGITLLSGQLGPRMLMLFMRDRSTQTVLGLFVGVFLYALIVLSFVSELEDGFVPSLAVSMAIILATLAFAVVIYFVHHMATAIQADMVVAGLGQDFSAAIARVCAAAAKGDPAAARRDAHLLERMGPFPVPAPRSGYVRHIDYARLVALAEGAGVTLHLTVRSDQFIAAGLPLMTVSGAEPDSDALTAAIRIGPRRDVLQEASYQARALVEIALRALSPGVNDPNTAVAAIDHLSAGLVDLARGPEVPRILFSANGRPVLVRPELGLGYYLDEVVPALLPVLRSDVLANERLIVLVKTLERVTRREPDRIKIEGWLAVMRAEITENALPLALRRRLLDLCEGAPANRPYRSEPEGASGPGERGL